MHAYQAPTSKVPTPLIPQPAQRTCVEPDSARCRLEKRLIASAWGRDLIWGSSGLTPPFVPLPFFPLPSPSSSALVSPPLPSPRWPSTQAPRPQSSTLVSSHPNIRSLAPLFFYRPLLSLRLLILIGNPYFTPSHLIPFSSPFSLPPFSLFSLPF